MLPSLHRICWGASVMCVMFAAGSAHAADPAAAQALFDDAKKLVAEGRWAAACPKLEESQRLDPGMGTEFHLASCHEHIGRNATAWAEYLDVASAAKTAGQGAREKAARDRAAALEPLLSRMKIIVPNDTPGLVVTRDGVEVGRGQWGAALPLDQGPHLLVARAPGKKTWERNIRLLADARTVEVSVPVLPDEPTGVVVPPAPLPVGEAAASVDPERGRGARIAGATLAIVGLAGIGVGTGFGLMSKSKHDDAQGHCTASNQCDTDGLGLRSDAIRDGTISTVAFIAGGAALATGAILWLTAPSSSSTPSDASPRSVRLQAAPQVGMGTMGLTVRGLF